MLSVWCTRQPRLRYDGVEVDNENNLADTENLGAVFPGLEAPSAFLVSNRGFLRVLEGELPYDIFHLETERVAIVHVAIFLNRPRRLRTPSECR